MSCTRVRDNEIYDKKWGYSYLRGQIAPARRAEGGDADAQRRRLGVRAEDIRETLKHARRRGTPNFSVHGHDSEPIRPERVRNNVWWYACSEVKGAARVRCACRATLGYPIP